MLFWVLTAILSAIVTITIISPLIVTGTQQNYRVLAFILCVLVPVFALGLYILNGAPELAN